MEDLFQFLVFLAFIFFALLGGGRKKKRPPTSTRSGSGGTATRERPGQTRRPPMDPGEIERILRQELGLPVPAPPQVPEPTPEPARRPEYTALPEPEPVSHREPEGQPPSLRQPEQTAWAAGLARRPTSLEVASRARPAEHARFHELYVEPSEPATVAGPAGPEISRAELRRLVIWREILGPPVGLRDG